MLTKTLLLLFAAALAFGVSGCAIGPNGQRAAGGASYTYERSADGAVTASVTTTRDIDSADISVNPDGTLRTVINGVSSRSDQYLGLVGKALDKLPRQ